MTAAMIRAWRSRTNPKSGMTIRASIRTLLPKSRRTMSRQPTIAPRTTARGKTISRKRITRQYVEYAAHLTVGAYARDRKALANWRHSLRRGIPVFRRSFDRVARCLRREHL